MSPDTDFFVELERRVWQALADGDSEADRTLLDPQFVGIYASGFASRDDHAAQLIDGPSVGTFSIHEPRLLSLASDAVVLSYRATFTRPAISDATAMQTMYVSSVWKRRGGNWVNVLSQDTLANGAAR